MQRNCIGCGQVDDHPRHHISIGEQDVFWHMDCHARSGSGCELCQAVVDSAKGAKGDKLREHIVKNDPAGTVRDRLHAEQEG